MRLCVYSFTGPGFLEETHGRTHTEAETNTHTITNRRDVGLVTGPVRFLNKRIHTDCDTDARNPTCGLLFLQVCLQTRTYGDLQTYMQTCRHTDRHGNLQTYRDIGLHADGRDHTRALADVLVRVLLQVRFYLSVYLDGYSLSFVWNLIGH